MWKRENSNKTWCFPFSIIRIFVFFCFSFFPIFRLKKPVFRFLFAVSCSSCNFVLPLFVKFNVAASVQSHPSFLEPFITQNQTPQTQNSQFLFMEFSIGFANIFQICSTFPKKLQSKTPIKFCSKKSLHFLASVQKSVCMIPMSELNKRFVSKI